MIYLIDRGFRIQSALNNLVNQVNCPVGYIKCQCLGCKVKSKVDVNPRSCFADDNVSDNDNQGTCFTDGNGNGNQVTYLSDDNDDDKYISIFSKRDSPSKQRDKPCSQCGCGGAL